VLSCAPLPALFPNCLLKLSIREQPLLPVLDVVCADWVGIRSFQRVAASLLPRMTEDPAYSS